MSASPPSVDVADTFGVRRRVTHNGSHRCRFTVIPSPYFQPLRRSPPDLDLHRSAYGADHRRSEPGKLAFHTVMVVQSHRLRLIQRADPDSILTRSRLCTPAHLLKVANNHRAPAVPPEAALGNGRRFVNLRLSLGKSECAYGEPCKCPVCATGKLLAYVAMTCSAFVGGLARLIPDRTAYATTCPFHNRLQFFMRFAQD
jgi:hypothetical protein